MFRRLYLSPIGIFISALLNLFAFPFRSFMIYGYWDKPSKQFRKHTRISSTAILESRDKIEVGDHVWIGHFNVLDGSNQITLGRGCQLAANVSIFTHGSQTAIRLYGEDFIKVPADSREGYTRGAVEIGDFTFIGAGCTIMPGVSLGKGCLVGAGSFVNISAPDYSVLVGSPAKIVGTIFEIDEPYLKNESIRKSYFQKDLIDQISK